MSKKKILWHWRCNWENNHGSFHPDFERCTAKSSIGFETKEQAEVALNEHGEKNHSHRGHGSVFSEEESGKEKVCEIKLRLAGKITHHDAIRDGIKEIVGHVYWETNILATAVSGEMIGRWTAPFMPNLQHVAQKIATMLFEEGDIEVVVAAQEIVYYKPEVVRTNSKKYGKK